ncbi:uncharacterized protein MONBRDRAFT_30996 [Monosiga brevicollis MX1]|uniref:Ubiquitin thioesterase OTU1 n=1 Tax=Monosiga brevicollis TaxID=81824 RepID=A9UQM7_MONBE|nr:uncharacterized protein MONBRDRAFT_30996 [Monosiga brevicollis MX1]EDQ92626.1 predicted protein [Monosiga brevicollis MX1]|eukprot:XP_001742388.1 hypothetical protein [Monosiga brevicollis MX1]
MDVKCKPQSKHDSWTPVSQRITSTTIHPDMLMLRVQTPQGMKRIQVETSATIADLLSKVAQEVGVNESFQLVTEDQRSLLPTYGLDATLLDTNLRKVDKLRLVLESAKQGANEQGAEAVAPTLDEVDRHLFKEKGQVPRSLDSHMCHHGPGGQCIHCAPLEPFDPQVLQGRDPPIKFLSFHSFLRRLDSGADKGRLSKLEDLQCTLKPCKDHPPYPRGICSKCQPSAVTLQRQFETPDILNRFLEPYRKTGAQRVGYLYGRYAPYEQVPLGIQAVVAAIYEPPQVGTADGLELQDDEHQMLVEQMAAALGLQRVGWIFTDLEAEDLAAGTVKHKRYVTHEPDDDTTVLTAPEILTAAMFQQSYPNPVPLRYNDTGFHGSKFVTVVVSGDDTNMISPKAYQVSTQAMALTRDDILRPTDRADMMAVKPRTDEVYVPDIFYVEKDKYGNQIKTPANPVFPVEYLFVDMEAGAGTGQGTFVNNPSAPFPIEHREAIGEGQNMQALGRYFAAGGARDGNLLRDFHLLFFLATDSMCNELQDSLIPLAQAMATRDSAVVQQWADNNPHWQTIKMLASESAQEPSQPCSMDELESRHRREKKELQSQVMALKKSVPKGDKKKKKEVDAQISKLEGDLNDRQQAEIADFLLGGGSDAPADGTTPVEASTSREADPTTVVQDANDDGGKKSKAQRRREKKEQEERERAKRIQDGEAAPGTTRAEMEDAALAELLRPLSLCVLPVRPDGNCMFRAVTHAADQEDPQVLREHMASLMRENKADFQPFLTNEEGNVLDDGVYMCTHMPLAAVSLAGCLLECFLSPRQPILDEYASYCDAMAQPGKWGGHCELLALSRLLKRPIKVFQVPGQPQEIGDAKDGQSPILLRRWVGELTFCILATSVLPGPVLIEIEMSSVFVSPLSNRIIVFIPTRLALGEKNGAI